MLLILAGLPVQGQIIMHDYTEADLSPAFQGKRSVERLCRIVNTCMPEDRNVHWKVVAKYDPSLPYSRFAAEMDRRLREMQIRFPADFPRWMRSRESMRQLTAWVFLAKLDLPPEHADRLKTHWLVRAVAAKAIQTLNRPPIPFVQEYPFAYTLTSCGYYPVGGLPVWDEMPGTPPALQQLNDEYAELLMESCARSGFFRRERFAEQLLLAAVNGEECDLAKLLPSESAAADPEMWFRGCMDGRLFAFYAPMSAVHFETMYRELAVIRWQDPDGKVQHCRLPELYQRRSEIPEYTRQVRQLSHDLARMSRNIHPMLHEPFNQLRRNLAEILAGREAPQDFATAERTLFAAVDRLMQIESMLSEVQKQKIPPGVRMANLLTAVRELRKHELRYPGVDKLLDRWDDYR